MKSYSSRELIKILMQNGWYECRKATGSHHAFKHPFKQGIVIVPHPKSNIPIGTLKAIEKQAQIKLE